MKSSNCSFETEKIKEKFQNVSSRLEYVKISNEMFEGNNDSVQNFKNLCAVEKDNLYTWLALGKSYEEGLDPKNSVPLIIGIIIIITTALGNLIFQNIVTEEYLLSFSIISFIAILGLVVSVCILVGNIIMQKMRVVQLNNLISSAIDNINSKK
ncbi:hypothetical protein RYX45_14335 [Alkalihalophilus pseudofirmus]|uniref:Uncharacterized protein n=1 Tax=Alkalihalophilus pseudofirmus TaxID=79885 RepID=A0AAJ2U1A4_ALKPS|nr:hypothetical protein [Alkalihalophilus pseudofirmus]MDV2886364.1 hypothetical protein [Alkalihalophilus pseudofirmus]